MISYLCKNLSTDRIEPYKTKKQLEVGQTFRGKGATFKVIQKL